MIRGRRRYARLWLIVLGWTAPVLDPCEDPHPQVPVGDFMIDHKMESFVRLVQSLGIETFSSCQGDPLLYERFDEHRLSMASVTVGSMRDALVVAKLLSGASSPRLISIETRPQDDSGYFFVNFDPVVLPLITPPVGEAA